MQLCSHKVFCDCKRLSGSGGGGIPMKDWEGFVSISTHFSLQRGFGGEVERVLRGAGSV